MILNLSQNFKPISGEEIQFESFTFSGGEPHLKITSYVETSKGITISHRLNSFSDLGVLCLAVDALKRMEVKMETLIVPYFPAARQDRVMVKGEPLSIKIYADIINNLGFKKVMVFDPHSEVTPALILNCEVISNHKFINKVIEIIGSEVILICPDGGALKKIYKVSEYLGGIEVVECSKSRDVTTGNLSGFKVFSEDLNGEACLIVDDICDGGGTFIGLAHKLKAKKAGKLYLAVSHGIFSKGFETLDCFEKIFTTDSIRNITNECLIQIAISDVLF